MNLERRVAGAGAEAGAAAVDDRGAFVDRREAVRHGGAKVVVGVHADLDVEAFAQSADTLSEAVGRQRAGGVGDVDAVGAVALHEARLEQQLLGRNHVRHHQEADRLHAQLFGHSDVLGGDVCLGAVSRDARPVTPYSRAF